MTELARALEVAIAVARECGEVLRADFHRAGGPRGGGDKADADTEAERLGRAQLLGRFPEWGYLGEETGSASGRDGAPIWLVDPNDGTRDYLKGRRGSSVSIGLLVAGVPRLGVVYAFGYPDDEGDLFAWAEGCGPLRRNGSVPAVVLPDALGPQDVVLVSSGGERHPEPNLACVAPARFRSVPSIAHRLALVAAGEASAAVSLNGPGAWDYAAGHALLRSAGATIVDENGREVGYGAGGTSRCRLAFAGRPALARGLARRPWRNAGGLSPVPEEFPTRLRRGEAVRDTRRLARAQGCLLGQVAGDSLGGLVEFQDQRAIARSYDDGPRQLVDGGRWGILAGQPTDDSEMALALARSIVSQGRFVRAAVRDAYESWLRSGPFDVGATISAALHGTPSPGSQANGSLMRASPLGVLGHALPPARLAELARQDASLTHVHPACGDATAAFVIAIAHAIRTGEEPRAAWLAAFRWAQQAAASVPVTEALELAQAEPPVCDGDAQGWVRLGLQNAFYELLHAPGLEEGVLATVRRGGDTDTNAAIAGALLGSVHGRAAVPQQWRSMVLSCHPHGRGGHPRPPLCWPTDVLELAERLLLAGERDTARSAERSDPGVS